jgi:predicted nucleic acid-binding protein
MPTPRSRTATPFGKTIYSGAVMIDTGAYLALYYSEDNFRKEALECRDAILAHNLQTFVSVPTVYETHNRILQKVNRLEGLRFLAGMLELPAMQVEATREDETKARQILEQFDWLDLSLTDAANMAIMLRLGIGVAFSFDRHFMEANFIKIPPFHLG